MAVYTSTVKEEHSESVIQGVFTKSNEIMEDIGSELLFSLQGDKDVFDKIRDYRDKRDDNEKHDYETWLNKDIESKENKYENTDSLKDSNKNLQTPKNNNPSTTKMTYKLIESNQSNETTNNEASNTGEHQLQKAIDEIKEVRKKLKENFKKEKLDSLKGVDKKKEIQKILFEDYPFLLDAFARKPLEVLQLTGPFKKGSLSLEKEGETFFVKDKKNRFAKLLFGQSEIFEEQTDNKGRKLYKKINKKTNENSEENEYIEDSRQVKTRRFAYMEKSFEQFMLFLGTQRMTGRYQIFHEAVGEKANLYDTGDTSWKKILNEKPDELTKEQLAVLHQRLGSGLQQRGLSLQSTAKKDVVFGNEGDSFKTPKGVRIKVDLAKVPDNVLLLNHYGEGGIIDSLDEAKIKESVRGTKYVKGASEKGNEYSYIDSVKKNRELYLEELKPDWIDEVTLHSTDETITYDLEELKKKLNYQDYSTGFEEFRGEMKDIKDVNMDTILKGNNKNALAKRDAKKINKDKPKINDSDGKEKTSGKKAGEQYFLGYLEGLKNNKKEGFKKLSEEYNTKTKEKRTDMYWIGYGHGLSRAAAKETLGENFFKGKQN